MVLQFPHFDPRVKPPLGTQLDRSDPINRGLVGCWLMNEGAGLKISSMAYPVPTGWSYGAGGAYATWIPGDCGHAVAFTLAGKNYIAYPPDASTVTPLMQTPQQTIIMRLRPGASMTQYAAICGFNNSGAAGLSIQNRSTSGPYKIAAVGKTTSSVSMAVPTVTCPAGVWVTCAAVYDGVATKMYYDGKLVATGATANEPLSYANPTPWSIGGDRFRSRYADCDVSYVYVWNRALTPSEIARLYRDPFCVLRRPASRAWLGAMSAGGTNHALIGIVTAAASLSGSLSVARTLAGAVNAAAVPAGVMSVARSAAGSAAGQSSLSGSLGVAAHHALGGSVAAAASLSATLSIARPLSGSANAIAIPTGGIAVARSAAGSAAGQSSLSGSLGVAVTASIAGGFTGGGLITLTVATPVETSISGGFTGGGAIVLGVATAENISLSGGFTGGGALFLLGSSAWAGNYDTKQYVVAFGNNQVWYCEV